MAVRERKLPRARRYVAPRRGAARRGATRRAALMHRRGYNAPRALYTYNAANGAR